MTRAGIEPATFRFVAQHFNHCATAEWNQIHALIPSWSCSQAVCMTYTIAVFTGEKTPDDGQKNCPKHVEFYSKNKFDNLVHTVGFVIRIA